MGCLVIPRVMPACPKQVLVRVSFALFYGTAAGSQQYIMARRETNLYHEQGSGVAAHSEKCSWRSP